MNNEKTITFRPGIPPKGPDRTRAIIGAVVVILAALAVANLVVILRVHPEAGTDLPPVLTALVGFLLLLSLLERVRKLEQAHKRPTSPGPFQAMIEDAKAAARAAGHDESQAQAVAQEVLTASIRSAGGWKA